MKIIMADTSTSNVDTNVENTCKSLHHLLNTLVWFRGRTEVGSFRCGYLRELDEAIKFQQGSDPSSHVYVYPFWEVMVCDK